MRSKRPSSTVRRRSEVRIELETGVHPLFGRRSLGTAFGSRSTTRRRSGSAPPHGHRPIRCRPGGGILRSQLTKAPGCNAMFRSHISHRAIQTIQADRPELTANSSIHRTSAFSGTSVGSVGLLQYERSHARTPRSHHHRAHRTRCQQSYTSVDEHSYIDTQDRSKSYTRLDRKSYTRVDSKIRMMTHTHDA